MQVAKEPADMVVSGIIWFQQLKWKFVVQIMKFT